MGTQQTVAVLETYVSLLRGCGDPQGAEAVLRLASAMAAAVDAKIKPTVTKVSKFWGRSPEMAATTKGLDGRLASLQKLLFAGGAKAVSGEIQLLVELLDSRREVDPSEFERLLRDAIEAPLPTTTPRVANKRETLSVAEVRRWADRLTAATADQSAFEAELTAVLAIPKLSGPDFKSIAEQYLGYEPPKGKPAILKKLRTRQKQDAMEAGRQSRIQRIAV